MGQNEMYPEYKSFNYPSTANTTIPDFEKEVTLRKGTTPELIFRQEYLAEFIEGGGEVFQDVRDVLGETLKEPVATHSYVAGVDLAKYQDFTVIMIADIATGEIVHFERFSKIDWNYQKDKIKEVCKRYNDAVL
jgi:hypothetical protein